MKKKGLIDELIFTTSRSGGPGGQNVNKVNTKVTLRFHIANSALLSEEEKTTLLEKLSNKITKEGELILTSREGRSQLQNKEAAILKFHRMLGKALTKEKARKPTKPSFGAVKKRLESKKKHAEKKKWRQIP